jgi:predicted DNA-binding transcriptional regulator AlpA
LCENLKRREQSRNLEEGFRKMEKLLNKDQAQRRLGKISRATLDRHIAKGLIIPTRIGRLVRFREVEVERFIKHCEAKARRQLRERDKNVVA